MTLALVLAGALTATGPVVPPAPDRAAELDAAIERANDDPEQGTEPLRRALAELETQPWAIARDPELRRLRQTASLVLARALLARGHRDAAVEVLDRTLREAHGAALDVAGFGPGLGRLHEERAAALAGRARLSIVCAVPCKAYVDEGEVAADGTAIELPLGNHRVLAEGLQGGRRFETRVALHVAGASETLRVPLQPPAKAAAGPPATPSPSPVRDAGSHALRRLPRGLEIALLVVGAATLATGVSLFAVDGNCVPGSENVPGIRSCDRLALQETAIAFTALGAPLLIAGSVTLAIDETGLGRRQRRGKR